MITKNKGVENLLNALSSFFDSISSFFSQIFFSIINIRIFDIIDILIVSFIIYKAIAFMRETRSGQLVKGIGVLFLVFFLSSAFNLITIKWILVQIFDYALVIVAIVFQPELRRILERVGQSNITTIGKMQNYDAKNKAISDCIVSVCKAVSNMSDKRVGALIVFERKTMLGEIINTGTVIDAEASYEMIGNIFFPKSPLHDGALVVREGKLYAAGCILPLTSNNGLNSQLGTRHRAAIGMSENSDAVVLVVSEETGTISLAINGAIKRDYNAVTLKEELFNQLLTIEEKNNNSIVRKFLDRFKKKD
ncbi:MAG: diadenylate cyclase CdaA [Clostridia bacterium]|nr:diadenylate cyclase CdaA [Clostridia bacterium]